MGTTTLEEAREVAAFIESERTGWESSWREVADYVLGFDGASGGIGGQQDGGSHPASSQGGKTGSRIIDATATRALRVLAAGLQGGLTPPARPWFRLKLADKALMEFPQVRYWLGDVEAEIYRALAGSNFYQSSHALFTELAAYGSADLYMESDPVRVMRFSVLPHIDFAWACDAAGAVDTVVRRYRLTARQLAEKYGESRLTRATRRLVSKEPYGKVELVQLVRPRASRDTRKADSRNMPFESLVWEAQGAQQLLHESGYAEFPHLCARWDVGGGQTYGRSPVMDVLPDVKMLQEMARSQLLAVHKVINPPMRVPTGFKQRLNLIPGAQNYVNPAQPDALSPLYQIRPDIQAVTYKIEDVRRSIREGLFTEMFLLFAGEARSNVTAAEIMERSQEKLLLLGPVVERHQTDILDPLIGRAFGLLARAGRLPAAPDVLAGRQLKVEYVSALAQAQLLSAAQGVRQLAGDVARFAAMAPQVLDKFDFEQAVDELASIVGAPARIVRSDEDVQRIRDERLQAEIAGRQLALLEEAGREARKEGRNGAGSEAGRKAGEKLAKRVEQP
ncbi:portal protein [Oleidesulfovibrio sp.]|uniref:portal protein n=1 Tax=Oleidesulfovibrio sp. TaxID=2909707 RepID=UPI003A88C2C8